MTDDQLNVFDTGNPPKDVRSLMQMAATEKLFDSMNAVGVLLGAHHALNGVMGAILTYTLAVETTAKTPGPALRREVCEMLRKTAQHLEQLPLTATAKTDKPT